MTTKKKTQTQTPEILSLHVRLHQAEGQVQHERGIQKQLHERIGALEAKAKHTEKALRSYKRALQVRHDDAELKVRKYQHDLEFFYGVLGE